MALTVGELVAFIDADDRGFRRGLAVAHKMFQGFRAKLATGLDDIGKKALGVAKLSALAGVIATLVTSVPSLVGALAPLVASMAALPAAGFAAIAMMGTLKLATQGMGEAFKAVAEGDAEKLNEALKKLSPSAAAFVRQIAKVAPAWKKIQKDVQETFFKPLVDDVAKLSKLYLPVARRGLMSISAALSRGAKNFTAWLKMPGTVKDVGAAFGGTSRIVSTLTGLVKPLSRAFLSLMVAAMPLLQRGAAQLVKWAESFDRFIETARNSGGLARFFAKIGDTFAQLGRIGKNVGRILAAVFGGVDTGNLLGTIEKLTARFAAFLESVKGQKLIEFLGKIAPVAGPALFFLSGIASAVSVLSTALGLLLSPVGAVLAVVALLAAALALAYFKFQPFRAAVDATARVVGGQFVAAIRTVVTWVRDQLIPTLAQLGAKMRPLLEEMARLWQQRVLPAINQVINAYRAQLKPTLDTITATIQSKVMPAVDRLTAAYMRNKPQIEQVVGWVTRAIAVFGRIAAVVGGSVVRTFITFAGVMLGQVINGIARMIGMIGAAVRAFNTARSAAGQLGSGISAAVSAAIRVVSGLPGRIRGALGSLGGLLYSAGRAVVQGLIDGIASMIGALGSIASRLAGAIADKLPGSPVKKGPLRSLNRGRAGRLIAQMLAQGMNQNLGAISAAASRMAGAVSMNTGAADRSGRLTAAGGRSISVTVQNAPPVSTEQQIVSALNQAAVLYGW